MADAGADAVSDRHWLLPPAAALLDPEPDTLADGPEEEAEEDVTPAAA